MEADRPMRVLFFGTFDENAHPRVAVLRESFEAMGQDVRTLNDPLKFDTADRVSAVGSPWKMVKPLVSLLTSWWRLGLKSRRLGEWKPDVVVVGYLAHLDVVLARLLFRCDIVFDMMVGLADTIESRGLNKGLFGSLARQFGRSLDRLAQRCASVTVYDTEAHRQLLSSAGSDDVVVPVGATRLWWARRSEAEPHEGLRVVFFGTYSPLQGATVIGGAISLLKNHHDISFTMIGDGQEREAVMQLAGGSSNVRWIDWLNTTELIEEVSTHDVCLGIFGTTPRSGRVIPNKVYQGIAAGCVVITGDYRSQSGALGDAVRLVAPGSASALADSLLELAKAPEAASTSSLDWASPASLGMPLLARLHARASARGVQPLE